MIAGDIGGTKCQLAAFEERATGLHLLTRQRYATGDYSSFEEVLSRFHDELRTLASPG